MENLSKVQQRIVKSVYDVKGSTHDRKVLLSNEICPKQKICKDLDFLRIEKNMIIDPSLKLQVFTAIKNDALFFQSCGIIDYSMIIFKVNRTDKFINDYFQQLYQGSLKMLKSQKFHAFQEKIYWHIGIIDYFQTWNTLKKMERKVKLIQGKGDPSSNDPKHYATRFINFHQ